MVGKQQLQDQLSLYKIFKHTDWKNKYYNNTAQCIKNPPRLSYNKLNRLLKNNAKNLIRIRLQTSDLEFFLDFPS